MRTSYRWLDGVLTDEECEEIIRFGTANLQQGNYQTGQSVYKFFPWAKRKGQVSWVAEGSELDPLMQRLVGNLFDVAKGHYFLDLNYVEPIQFSHYHKLAHYGWHVDSSTNGIAASRLISATVELSDPDDHMGGNLKLRVASKNCGVEKKRGRMVIFPSIFPHKVTPVLAGTRHSLVLWAHIKEPMDSQIAKGNGA
jgi:PKHD-type hydroxylase